MSAQCGRGWTDRCKTAKGPKCTCKCRGENHGILRDGSQKKLELVPQLQRTSIWVTDEETISKVKVFQDVMPPEMLATRLDFTKGQVNKEPGMTFRTSKVPEKIYLARHDGRAFTNVARELVYHSPDGFEWGYGGSAPSDLALNILNQFVDPATAWKLHIEFKFEFLAGLGEEGGTITAQEIRNWLTDNGVVEQ